MVVLEGPYVSDLMLDWLAESKHPVLDNDFARSQAASLNLVDEDVAAHRIDTGEKLYTNSENALAWVLSHTDNANLHRVISLCKDKAAMRELLAPLAPDLFFARYDFDQLTSVDVEMLTLPVVLKPAVGFCSLGVFVIESPSDWHTALDAIRAQTDSWARRFPDAVVDLGDYLVESYITGDEYAVDAYFDENGKANILAIFRHEFASDEDTSDRLYYECDQVIDAMLEPMTDWLNQVNELMGARNFPFHGEVRVANDGRSIVPIEFNPLRFAGLCFTDISWYAWGLRTYEAFFENELVDLHALAHEHAGQVFTMALLKPDEGVDSKPSVDFDYDAFLSQFSHVLALRRFDVETTGLYGCLFLKTDASTAKELDYLLRVDLSGF